MNSLLDIAARPVIAHRGASGAAPENTLPAFELAVQQGADAFELDVRLTADHVPVVIHDPTLERTTSGTGRVATQTLAQLRQADAGARFSLDAGRTFPFRAVGVVIPTLAEVLRAFPEMPLLLDIKESLAQDAIRRVLLDERAVGRCVLASDDAAALAAFNADPFSRAASPQEIAALFWGSIPRAIWRGRERRDLPPGYRLLSVPRRHRGIPVPTAAFLSAARRLGCPVHVWTVNDASLAQQLWRAGVAGIVTNLPDRMRAIR
jgi:glycerophosphoryl diester phosphodiesterase